MILETLSIAAALSLLVGGFWPRSRTVEPRECQCWKPAGTGPRCSVCCGLAFRGTVRL